MKIQFQLLPVEYRDCISNIMPDSMQKTVGETRMIRETALAFVDAINSHNADKITTLMTDDHTFIDAFLYCLVMLVALTLLVPATN